MSILHDWTPREKAALERRLVELHAEQNKGSEPIMKVSIYDGVEWCYERKVWVVTAFIAGKRRECGTTGIEAEAPDIQWRAVRASILQGKA